MELLDRTPDHRHASLIVASVATVGSLYFSLGMGLVPCDLCWYQRILMYPLVPFLAVGILKGDYLRPYVLPLSIGGFTIASYHNYIHLSPGSGGVCSSEVPCSIPQHVFPGGITIPMMSLAAFGIITALFLLPEFVEIR